MFRATAPAKMAPHRSRRTLLSSGTTLYTLPPAMCVCVFACVLGDGAVHDCVRACICLQVSECGLPLPKFQYETGQDLGSIALPYPPRMDDALIAAAQEMLGL